MSAFVVYGVTRTMALSRAKRRHKWPGFFTLQWAYKVGITAAHIYATAKPAKCSGEYDAPQFAQNFIEVGLRTNQIRLAHIRKAETDTNKKGKKVVRWRPYDLDEMAKALVT